ncbi:UNKNOWN [Stylonychia lemnae]|uniref:Uncharacterized protein n=1 Tax=Stylonychia lemnae TaxID=5949 RepID=A0A078APB8_STYLE|nr:UNKNOWN [Stylonychia lemnae]|eukprot:CDW83786.1 UNKNOWN [Stylonychia lemnae]
MSTSTKTNKIQHFDKKLHNLLIHALYLEEEVQQLQSYITEMQSEQIQEQYNYQHNELHGNFQQKILQESLLNNDMYVQIPQNMPQISIELLPLPKPVISTDPIEAKPIYITVPDRSKIPTKNQFAETVIITNNADNSAINVINIDDNQFDDGSLDADNQKLFDDINSKMGILSYLQQQLQQQNAAKQLVLFQVSALE